MSLEASELYAVSQGTRCEGGEQCHYCGAACRQHLHHIEPSPLPGTKRPYVAKRPGNPFICVGCWLWRRRSITVEWPDNGETGKKHWKENNGLTIGMLKDRQTPQDHSWLLTDERAWALQVTSSLPTYPSDPINDVIYQRLLKPPIRFALSFIEGTAKNQLQLCIANEIAKIEADTPMAFTVNGVVYYYCVYELEEALKNGGEQGREPGVQMLVRLLGPCGLFEDKKEPKKSKMGRPPALPGGQSTKAVISASGK